MQYYVDVLYVRNEQWQGWYFCNTYMILHKKISELIIYKDIH